ncbi:MAG: hypothetical protein IJ257_06960 [Treponema sp.]|nr:hypothetical protein [Treponema sp.]
MFRKFFLAFLFFVLILPAFSLGGVLADSSAPLHVIQTQYFDIIFPEECRKTAEKIGEVCDDYYLEITSKLETRAYQRFPVTITRSVEMLNAYFAAVPYNRIVLYDTYPEKSLDMYEDTIQSVFYHELTHAVTYNMKGPLLRKFSFFADALNPAWLSVTTFWAEGATVSFESKGRGGRLNDPFNTQLVNQSLIDGKFPSWRDVTGARDTYPGGSDAYMFGSMFASYLQETYGMSKYAEFWKRANSRLTFSFIAGVFEKTYGKSISESWDEFKKTLEIPHSEKKANLLSPEKSRITTFDAFFDRERKETEIAYFDASSSALRLLTLDEGGSVISGKKLLAITGIVRVTFSPDGKKLALSRYIDKKNYKSVTAYYDLEKGKYHENPESGYRDAYFKNLDGKIEFADIPMYNAQVPEEKKPHFYSKEEIPFCPLSIDDNLSALIIKDGLSWKIRLYDDKQVLCEYDFSDFSGAYEPGLRHSDNADRKSLILHNLHLLSSDSAEICLSFTWAELGMGGKMLSRAGLLKIQRNTLESRAFLQKENGFAGLAEAIAIPNTFSFFVTAAEYEGNPLYHMEMSESDFEEVKVAKKMPSFVEGLEKTADSESESAESQNLPPALSNEVSYNPFKYYPHGIFIPLLAEVPVYNHDLAADSSLALGLTFISTNPWGDKRLTFSAGYNPFFKNGGMFLSLSGGNDSFSYSLGGTCIFDRDSFMQTVGSLSAAKVFWRGKVTAFSAGIQGNFLYGRQLTDDYVEKNRDDSVGKSADGQGYLLFSNIHKISARYADYAGVALQPFVLTSFRSSEKLPEDDKYVNAGLTTNIRFPIFIPFIFSATLFPSSKYAASGSVRAILHSFEIHKGIPALSLFMQRIVLSASYSGKIAYTHGEFWDIKKTDEIFKKTKKSDYSDEIRLSLNLYLSPNTGFFASGDIQFSLGYAMLFRPNPKSSEKKIAYGITFSMAY